MPKSRALWYVTPALCLLGLAFGLSHHLWGDDGVQKTSNSASTGAANAQQPPRPATIGTVDMEAIWRGYEKVKYQLEQLKADGLAKQQQLNQLVTEATEIKKEMDGYVPGSPDFKLRESKIMDLKAKLQAEQEKASREFDTRHAEVLAAFYKEVQEMVALVARHRGYSFVVKVSNEPVSASNPDAVMVAMSKSVVYSDPSADVTQWVLYNMNHRYIKSGGKTVASGGNTPADPQAAQAAATGPAAAAVPGTPNQPSAVPGQNAARPR